MVKSLTILVICFTDSYNQKSPNYLDRSSKKLILLYLTRIHSFTSYMFSINVSDIVICPLRMTIFKHNLTKIKKNMSLLSNYMTIFSSIPNSNYCFYVYINLFTLSFYKRPYNQVQNIKLVYVFLVMQPLQCMFNFLKMFFELFTFVIRNIDQTL